MWATPTCKTSKGDSRRHAYMQYASMPGVACTPPHEHAQPMRMHRCTCRHEAPQDGRPYMPGCGPSTPQNMRKGDFSKTKVKGKRVLELGAGMVRSQRDLDPFSDDWGVIPSGSLGCGAGPGAQRWRMAAGGIVVDEWHHQCRNSLRRAQQRRKHQNEVLCEAAGKKWLC